MFYVFDLYGTFGLGMDSVLKLPDVTADVLQLLIFFNKLTNVW